ncbi:MAG: hypothetical protein CM1200mP40_18230 [Gammaproteobacteria bacterium]|nr:MAG: hypothetical protein CM1200mP40_18230 [Gammaproteobacteria bacterium]
MAPDHILPIPFLRAANTSYLQFRCKAKFIVSFYFINATYSYIYLAVYVLKFTEVKYYRIETVLYMMLMRRIVTRSILRQPFYLIEKVK